MSRTIRARFDGNVFVPREPVEGLAVDEEVEVALPRAPGNHGEDGFRAPAEAMRSMAAFVDWIESLPMISDNDAPTDGAKNYKHYLYGHPKVD